MKRQYSLTTLAFIAGTLGTASALGPAEPGKAAPSADTMATESTKAPSTADTTTNWPDAPKKAAGALKQAYGAPDESTDRLVAWNDRGDFSKIIVYRDAVTDPVPTPHQTFVEHQVRYTAPAFKVGDLQNFDKSLVIDTKNGTLSSRGDNVRSNVLALNLADEIVTGKRTVADAQHFRARTESLTQAGKVSPMTQKLMFTPDKAGEPHMIRALPPY